jgi:ribonuclease T1
VIRLVALLLAFAANAWAGDLPVADLPPEARATLDLIRAGGPFPQQQDGRTFGNREKLLPQRARGYYREYTVRTPGARDRGARRIVAGRGGEFYYTADHYRSFQRIRE